MKSIVAALKFLTLWNRFALHEPASTRVGKAAPYFPLVGLILGLLLALLQRGLENYLDAEILSILLAAVLIVSTGAIHLEGMQNTFTANAAAQTRMTNSAGGIAAIILVLLFKIKAIDVLEVKLTLGLLLTPALARWALIVFIYGSHRHCEGEARIIAENVKFWHVLLTSIAILAPTTYLLGRTGLWIGLCLSAFALTCRALLQRRSGLTRDNFGAIIELSEALCLTLLASL